jgi:hypothetical protein
MVYVLKVLVLLLKVLLLIFVEGKWESRPILANLRYLYDKENMFPMRFKTIAGDSPRQTWLTFYYNSGSPWGQLRWSERTWGVELYGCTDDKLYTTNRGDRFQDVPEGLERVWTVSWNTTSFSVDCNGKNVWMFQFKDRLDRFSDSSCGQTYAEQRGPLKTFKFNKYGAYGELLNAPREFFIIKEDKEDKKDKKDVNDTGMCKTLKF